MKVQEENIVGYTQKSYHSKRFFKNASCCPEAKRRNVNTSGSIKHVTCKIKPEGYQKPRLKANQIFGMFWRSIYGKVLFHKLSYT